jgi:hypothetical protein
VAHSGWHNDGVQVQHNTDKLLISESRYHVSSENGPWNGRKAGFKLPVGTVGLAGIDIITICLLGFWPSVYPRALTTLVSEWLAAVLPQRAIVMLLYTSGTRRLHLRPSHHHRASACESTRASFSSSYLTNDPSRSSIPVCKCGIQRRMSCIPRLLIMFEMSGCGPLFAST